jgi:hypothetical protein
MIVRAALEAARQAGDAARSALDRCRELPPAEDIAADVFCENSGRRDDARHDAENAFALACQLGDPC